MSTELEPGLSVATVEGCVDGGAVSLAGWVPSSVPSDDVGTVSSGVMGDCGVSCEGVVVEEGWWMVGRVGDSGDE